MLSPYLTPEGRLAATAQVVRQAHQPLSRLLTQSYRLAYECSNYGTALNDWRAILEGIVDEFGGSTVS